MRGFFKHVLKMLNKKIGGYAKISMKVDDIRKKCNDSALEDLSYILAIRQIHSSSCLKLMFNHLRLPEKVKFVFANFLVGAVSAQELPLAGKLLSVDFITHFIHCINSIIDFIIA